MRHEPRYINDFAPRDVRVRRLTNWVFIKGHVIIHDREQVHNTSTSDISQNQFFTFG